MGYEPRSGPRRGDSVKRPHFDDVEPANLTLSRDGHQHLAQCAVGKSERFRHSGSGHNRRVENIGVERYIQIAGRWHSSSNHVGRTFVE